MSPLVSSQTVRGHHASVRASVDTQARHLGGADYQLHHFLAREFTNVMNVLVAMIAEPCAMIAVHLVPRYGARNGNLDGV